MRLTLSLFLVLTLLFQSCSKDEGVGGLATLEGKVFIQEFNGSGIMVAEYYAPEERVYIVYGNNEIYDDETRTHYDGGFRFEYLRKGIYTIFAYSDCPTCPGETEAIMQTVEINDRKATITMEDLVIAKY